MKVKFIICFFLLSTRLTFAQDVVYRFLEPKDRLEKPKNIRRGNTTSLVVENVNTLLYNVVIEGKNISTEINDTEFFNTNSTVKVLGNFLSTAQKNVLAGAPVTDPTSFIEWKGEYLRLLGRLDAAKDLYQTLYNTAYKDDQNEFLKIQATVTGSDKNTALDKNFDFFPNPGAVENIVQRGDKLLDDLQKAYDNVIIEYDKLSDANKITNLAALRSVMNQQLKVGSADYKTVFKNMASLYKKVTDKNTFFVSTPRIVATKDIVSYSILITPKKDLDKSILIPTRTDTLNGINIAVKGGVSFDFSAGLLGTFGDPRDHSYKIAPLPGSTETVTIQEIPDRNQFNPFKVGGIVHASPRWPSAFRPAFSVGFNLNTSDLKDAALLIGGSLIIKDVLGIDGRWLVLSSGVALRKVQYLKPDFVLGETYAKAEIPESLTEGTWRSGFFVGISYNFNGKVKTQ